MVRVKEQKVGCNDFGEYLLFIADVDIEVGIC